MNILITGGSRGIGAAAVKLFAARGDRVWFLYEKSYEKARALSFDTGAVGICCDVADEAAVQAAFRELPPLDGLICNAGIAHYGLISEITPDAWRRIFAVNVDGVFHCVRAALPGMLQKQAGAIAYADRFISPAELISLSKVNRQIDSQDAQRMTQKGQYASIRILLFVRRSKDDDEAKAFYFLGAMHAAAAPQPPSFVALPPSPTTSRLQPRSNAWAISSPTP